MTVYDLNRDQLTELKQHYYAEKTGEELSYGELAEIDDLVSDREVQEYYSDTSFVMDDFWCTAGQDEPERRGLSMELGEAIQILANTHRYQVIFNNPGLSSTEAKVRKGVQNALSELNKAYQAALELGY